MAAQEKQSLNIFISKCQIFHNLPRASQSLSTLQLWKSNYCRYGNYKKTNFFQ